MVNGGRTNQGLTGSAGVCPRAGSGTGGLSRFECSPADSPDGSASDSAAESSSESVARATGVARRALRQAAGPVSGGRCSLVSIVPLN